VHTLTTTIKHHINQQEGVRACGTTAHASLVLSLAGYGTFEHDSRAAVPDLRQIAGLEMRLVALWENVPAVRAPLGLCRQVSDLKAGIKMAWSDEATRVAPRTDPQSIRRKTWQPGIKSICLLRWAA
jgi:hypothetical protein